MSDAPNILIVTSRYYAEIMTELEAGVVAALEAGGAQHEFLEVPGAFEVPGAIALVSDADEYDGYIALGCVIRGETSHYDHICNEVARGLMNLSLAGIPVGFGVLTCENKDQAMVRASRSGKNKGAEVVAAVLRMVELSNAYSDDE